MAGHPFPAQGDPLVVVSFAFRGRQHDERQRGAIGEDAIVAKGYDLVGIEVVTTDSER
jgi:hypothetical protein